MDNLDPKPWICLNCSDRFARQNLLSVHELWLRPRTQFNQDLEAYDATRATEA